MHFSKTCKLDINFPMPFILPVFHCVTTRTIHRHIGHDLLVVAVFAMLLFCFWFEEMNRRNGTDMKQNWLSV